MKLEDLAYAIVQKIFHELEHTHHFVVPKQIQQDIIRNVQDNMDTLIK